MVSNNLQKIKKDKLTEGTITIIKYDKGKMHMINELFYFDDCLKTAPMNENSLLNTITMCEDYYLISYLFGCCHDTILSKQHIV